MCLQVCRSAFLCCVWINDPWQDIAQSYTKHDTADQHEEQNALKLFYRLLKAPFKHAVITSGKLQVGRAGQKKKARMARTRSDFLTRAPILSVGGDSDEDDYDGDSSLSPRHFTLPLSKQSSTDAGLGESCFSDSDMVTGTIQANSGPLCVPKAWLLFDISNPLSRESIDLHHTSDSNWASANFCFLKMYNNFL